jgi:Putative peptidoglycan binding domain
MIGGLRIHGTVSMNMQAQANPSGERVPDIKTPISEHRGHPVNSTDVGVYYSRTDNLVVQGRVLSDQEQIQKLADAMRSVGPGKVMLIEASGPRDGDYTDDLRRTLPAALALVPPGQRPEIRLFVSDGRPVIGDQNNPNGPYNDFATFLQQQDRNKPGSGTVQTDNSQSVPRAVPNWNNPAVVDFFVENRVQPAVKLAKDLGIGSVMVDDHIGIPPGPSMDAFKRVNGFNDTQVQNAITGAYERVLGTIDSAGLNTGISSAADPQGSLRMGIDMARLAPRADVVEIQGYRPTVDGVQKMADNLYDNISNNFERYRGVDEFRIALATRANGQDISAGTLQGQQAVVDRLEERLGELYRQKGATPPEVNCSLWAHQHFFEDPTLRRGDEGQRVTRLQEALNGAGIRVNGEPLPTSGNFLDMTKTAVEQYQRQSGLAVTGEANKETQVALGIHPGLPFVQNQQQTPQQPQTPPTTGQPTTLAPTQSDPKLSPGAGVPAGGVPRQGDDVRKRQEALTNTDPQPPAQADKPPTTIQTPPPVQADKPPAPVNVDPQPPTQTDKPLISNSNHPDNRLYQQAITNLEQLGPSGGFKSREDLEKAAAAVAVDAKATGLNQIDHISKTNAPNGQSYLVAVQGDPTNPAAKSAYIDYNQATSQTVAQSTSMAESQKPAVQAQSVPQTELPMQDTNKVALGVR